MVPLFRFMSTSVPLCAWHQKIEHHDPCVLKHPAYQMPNLQPSRIAPSRRVEVLTSCASPQISASEDPKFSEGSPARIRHVWFLVQTAGTRDRSDRGWKQLGILHHRRWVTHFSAAPHLTGCAHRPAGLQMGALLQHKQRNYVRSLALAPSSDRGVSAGHL